MTLASTLTILFYIFVNIIILLITTVASHTYDSIYNKISIINILYLIVLGIAFWFYFQTTNMLIGISFPLYLVIIYIILFT